MNTRHALSGGGAGGSSRTWGPTAPGQYQVARPEGSVSLAVGEKHERHSGNAARVAVVAVVAVAVSITLARHKQSPNGFGN